MIPTIIGIAILAAFVLLFVELIYQALKAHGDHS